LFIAAVALGVLLGAVSSATARKAQTGVFNVKCKYTHSLSDDPLMYPRRPRAAHLHDFFGNKLTDAFSTGASLLAAARRDREITSCIDTADSAAYWAPALYRDGQKLDPWEVLVYYRNASEQIAVPFPVGFGMIAGDMNAKNPNQHVRWECSRPPLKSSPSEIPNCESGDLQAVIKFPVCWNGVDLFEMDQSHVEYGPCRGSHPIRIPELTVIVKYPHDHKPHEYHLSSGPPMTLHSDFFNAWEPSVLALLVKKCNNEQDENGRRRSCQHDESLPPDCNDLLDNDSDFKRDHPADAGCSSSGENGEHVETRAQCTNNKDDDGDGLIDDERDPGCTNKADDNERDTVMPQCSDGTDNDRDRRVDYPADAGCRDRSDVGESGS
jgi:hypothetical protein